MKKTNFYTKIIEDLTHEGLALGRSMDFRYLSKIVFQEKSCSVEDDEDWKKPWLRACGGVLEVIFESCGGERRPGTWGQCRCKHMTYESRWLPAATSENDDENCENARIRVRPTLEWMSALGYRNKAQIPVRMVDGQLIYWFLQEELS